MKILYDHQMFLEQKYGGISKYFCELIKNIPANTDYELSVLFSNNQHLKDERGFFKKFHFPLPAKNFKGKGFLKRNFKKLNKTYSEIIISKNNFDLLHPTYFDPYFLGILKRPYVITIHDLIDFKYKNNSTQNSLIPKIQKIVDKANRIIAISQNTKKDLVETMNVDPEKIDVIYHGYNKGFSLKKDSVYGTYILYVGIREGYKNFTTFIKAVSLLFEKDINLRLICVGSPFSKFEMELLKKLNISNRVIALGVNENKLNELYSNALAFVYPSLYEGFGMPILEAFANNCPVCLSKSSSFPEIAVEAGSYFDPFDEYSIKESISKVIYDDNYSKKLIELGSKRLKDFSWKKCAEETIDSYKKALV